MSRKLGIITISDSCYQGIRSCDESGNNLVDLVNSAGIGSVQFRLTVPDEKIEIQNALIKCADELYLDLVLTTGGTGFSPRDVTPEATKSVIEKEAPGLVHRMMSESLKVTPMAMLSRLCAGIRKSTLIVNFPGSKKASQECFKFVIEALPHALDLISNDNLPSVESVHHNLQSRGCGGGHCSSTKDANTEMEHYDQGVAHRPRVSPFPMISVEEAQNIVFSEAADFPPSVSHKSYQEALGKILAEDIKSLDPLPPFPASIKDGYAVLNSDGKGIRRVIGNSNAGNDPKLCRVTSGTCMRINTGAPVPPGADAVVQVEDTKLIETTKDGKEEYTIEICKDPCGAGQDIRPIGSDIPNDVIVLKKGCLIGPSELGICATVGVMKVPVYDIPKVSLLSTGNELQDPNDDKPLKAGFIRDSNKTTISMLLMSEGINTFKDIGIATDHINDLTNKLKNALNQGDVIVTTGGVSMGDKDLLRQVLMGPQFKAKLHFARVRMKPGKPTSFFTLDQWEEDGRKKMILGLPGNPVSATVTCHLYLLPLLRKLSGHTKIRPSIVKGILPHDIELDPRPEYARVIMEWKQNSSEATLTLTGNQISSRLLSLTGGANGLLMLPMRTENIPKLRKGTICDVMAIGPLRN